MLVSGEHCLITVLTCLLLVWHDFSFPENNLHCVPLVDVLLLTFFLYKFKDYFKHSLGLENGKNTQS